MSWNITCTAAVLNLLVETTWQQKHFMSARQNALSSILYTSVQKFTYLNACSILGSAIKCPLKSKRKPTVCNLMVTVGVRVIFRLRLGYCLFLFQKCSERDTSWLLLVRISRQKLFWNLRDSKGHCVVYWNRHASTWVQSWTTGHCFCLCVFLLILMQA